VITSLKYAEIANAVYQIGRTNGNWVVDDFYASLFEEGGWGTTKTKFKGCVYARDSTREVVVALQGTDFGSKIGDWYADLQIVLGILPQYCGAAQRLLERTLSVFHGYKLSITGHSLGGGLAQVIGHWTGYPFVSFNAPGMWGDIQKCKFLSEGKWCDNSWEGTYNSSMLAKQRASTGRNFRNWFDPVSAYGFHYGPVTRLRVAGWNPHSMDNLVNKIDRTPRWRNVNPVDPSNKEWGELD